MKKLQELHQEALNEITDREGNQIYPDGYPVPDGDPKDPKLLSDASHYHILFIDILPDGKRHRNIPTIQKYQPHEWKAILKIVENPDFGVNATGHDEFSVLHDPIEMAEEQAKKAAKEQAANVKPGTVKAGRPAKK